MHTLRLLVPCAALLAGCKGDSLPPETDPARGREVLKTVLDTWVKGGTPNDLKALSPPIVVSDPDWEAGRKLVKYEVAPTDGRTGVDLLLSVTLTLQREDGQTQQKTVNFAVGVGSNVVVLRYT